MSNSIPSLSKITTVYVPAEDRVRISALLSDNSIAVIWMTQRFLNRLIPVLVKWIETQAGSVPRADLLQEVQQKRMHEYHKARVQGGEEAPVDAEAAEAQWLAVTIDIQLMTDQVCLIFKDKDGEKGCKARLVLPLTLLRQWLNVIEAAYVQAAWPKVAWPVWMGGEKVPERELEQQCGEQITVH